MVQDLVYTQTIDVKFVNKILSHCPNYDFIINYEYEYGDIFTSKLIDWYREIIFAVNGNDYKQLMILEAIDNGISMYLKNNDYKYEFRKKLSIEDISLENKNLIKSLIKNIIVFTSNYINKKYNEIENSIWI